MSCKRILINLQIILLFRLSKMGEAISLLLQKSEAVQSMQNLSRPIKLCRNVGLQIDMSNTWNNCKPSPPAEHKTQLTQTDKLSVSDMHTQTDAMDSSRSESEDALRISQMGMQKSFRELTKTVDIFV